VRVESLQVDNPKAGSVTATNRAIHAAGRNPSSIATVTIAIDLDDLAERVADKIAAKLETAGVSPWLDVRGAAEHLSCSVERVRKLVGRRGIPFHQEQVGGRVFFHRHELDKWLLAQ
jgi:excisionase family DNA binding protein